VLVGDIVRLTAARSPHRTAVVSDRRSSTYQQLLGRCEDLAAALRSVAEPGSRVAVLAENVPEYIEAYYGVPMAGMVLTFINYRLHPREMAWILRDCDAAVLIVERGYLDAIEPLVRSETSVGIIVCIGEAAPPGTVAYEDFLAATPRDAVAPKGAAAPVPAEEDPAWLLYTSGTTGFPKGAILTHRNLVASTLSFGLEFAIEADDRYLAALPLCHISSHGILAHHLRGATAVLLKRFTPEAWFQAVDAHGITMTGLAAALAISLLADPLLDQYRLDSFRIIVTGAGSTPVAVLRRLIERFGPVFCTGYGLTEATGTVTLNPTRAFVRALQGEEHLLLSCGQTMCMVEVKLVDEHLALCPTGVVGEILLRGDQIFAGYWKNEEASRQAFAAGWLRTGDLARQDEEGYFYVIDRLKDMIKTGGENVYSREVEEVIFDHPGVRDVAVIAVDDERWGEKVTAVVVPAPDAGLTTGGLVSFCRERLAGFKVPKQVIVVDELPRNAAGKVLKAQLRSKYNADGGSQVSPPPEQVGAR
jgi:acyl-CoA synthetase (AMP-forming)/AMP-acid ligase II